MQEGVERLCSLVSWAETVWVTRVRTEALAVAEAHQHFCPLPLLRNYDVKGVGKSISCLGVIQGGIWSVGRFI